MPTRIEVDCATGEQHEVEMTGAELASYEALRAVPVPGPPVSDDEFYETYLAMAQEESPDVGVQILVEVIRAMKGISA